MSSYDVRVRSASASFAIPSVVVLRNYEKRGAEKAPKFSKRLMMLRDGYRCQYCKDSFPPSLLTCDHVCALCGKEPAPPHHRAGVASLANAP